MKIQSTPRDDHQVKLVVEVENDQLERKMRKAARHISEHAKIPGFRPGKAPYDVVLRYAGEEQVKNEAIEMLVEDLYPQVLKEQNIEPGAMGSLEEIVSEDPLTFSFIVPLAPVVTLNDYTSVRVPYEAPVIDDKRVEKAVDEYRNYFATMEPVEGAAAEGNTVLVSVEAKDGEEELVPSRTIQVKIAPATEEVDQEWPFKGFGRKLIGLMADAEKTISHKFPADATDEKLQGKKVEFKVKVVSVKNAILPELDQDFLKNFGTFESADEFKAKIRESIENESQADYDYQFYRSVLNEMRSKAEVKYPPQILKEESDQLIESFTHELSHQRMDLEAYLKMRGLSREEFIEKEISVQAKDRLERNLIMQEIAKVEDIKLTEEEMQTGYTEALNDLSQSQDLDQLVKKSSKEKVVNAIAMEGASRMMNRRIYSVLKSIATGTYKAQTEEAAAVDTVVEEKPKAKKTRAKASKAEAGTE